MNEAVRFRAGPSARRRTARGNRPVGAANARRLAGGIPTCRLAAIVVDVAFLERQLRARPTRIHASAHGRILKSEAEQCVLIQNNP